MDMSGTLDAFERKLTGQINCLEKRIKRLEGINGHFAMVIGEQDAKIAKLRAELDEAKR